MRFCDNCGSYMKESAEGYRCPRCGATVHSERKSRRRQERLRNRNTKALYVVDEPQTGAVKIAQTCPECGNAEAFRWVSHISGEHAGVSRERTVEHFQCTKCRHEWARSS